MGKLCATLMTILFIAVLATEYHNHDNIEVDIEVSQPEVYQAVYEIPEEPQLLWTSDELDMLAALIYYEAGSDDCTDRHQQLVGQVVLNRVASNEFPNTIYDVITQVSPAVQYSTYKHVLDNMGNRDIIPQRCYNNALVALNGWVDCPDDVVWQANFVQGSSIYEEIHTSYSVSYFCHR